MDVSAQGSTPIFKSSPKIIAIAAVSGGGKTTVTKRLNEMLGMSEALFFDDYDFDGPENIIDWVERGSDLNEWNIEPMLKDMEKLKSSEEVNYILLDYPFARRHNQLTEIDLTVFIDTPLDIAMARRLLRDYSSSNLDAVLSDLSFYVKRGRTGYENMLRTTKPNSDLIVDGALSVDGIVNLILAEIRKNPRML